jgi:hypothetical protein
VVGVFLLRLAAEQGIYSGGAAGVSLRTGAELLE